MIVIYLKAKDVVNGKRPLEEFIDPRVRNEVIIEDFVLILKIAVLCVASSSIGRPTIKGCVRGDGQSSEKYNHKG